MKQKAEKVGSDINLLRPVRHRFRNFDATQFGLDATELPLDAFEILASFAEFDLVPLDQTTQIRVFFVQPVKLDPPRLGLERSLEKNSTVGIFKPSIWYYLYKLSSGTFNLSVGLGAIL